MFAPADLDSDAKIGSWPWLRLLEPERFHVSLFYGSLANCARFDQRSKQIGVHD